MAVLVCNPPTTEAGESIIDVRVGSGRMVIVAVWLTPLHVAVICAIVKLETAV